MKNKNSNIMTTQSFCWQTIMGYINTYRFITIDTDQYSLMFGRLIGENGPVYYTDFVKTRTNKYETKETLKYKNFRPIVLSYMKKMDLNPDQFMNLVEESIQEKISQSYPDEF